MEGQSMMDKLNRDVQGGMRRRDTDVTHYMLPSSPVQPQIQEAKTLSSRDGFKPAQLEG